MSDLVKAGKELRTAQEHAGGEPGRRRLQDAIERHRAALKNLVDEAEEILREEGRSAGNAVDRVWSTLRAGSLDEGAHDQLLEGRLDHEIESSGFPTDLTLQAAEPKRGRGRAERTERQRSSREARDEVKRRRAEVQASRRRLREVEENARKAKQAWERAEKQAEGAREALAAAEESLAEGEGPG